MIILIWKFNIFQRHTLKLDIPIYNIEKEKYFQNVLKCQ